MTNYLLLFILFSGGILRIWNLSEYPSGLNADEAALGYNAYSLMLTGRDEHGSAWPVNLESFGDYKPAGYAYLLIPFIKTLGLTEFAVRLPSALFGIFALCLVYFLVKDAFSQRAALLSAAFLAVSPWHIHFSRGGWEVNVSTTLIILGVWMCFKWLKDEKISYLLVAALALILSMYFYQSARVTAPLIGLGIFFLERKNFLRQFRQVFVTAVFSLALLTPLALSVLTTDASSRFSGVGLLADTGPLRRVEQLRGQHAKWDSFVSRLFHNRPVAYGIQFLSNYFDHFDGDFLFVNGDEIQRNRVPETGLLYLTDIVLIVLGFWFIIRNPNRSCKLIWLWLLVAPAASGLTFQTPHALRSHSLVIPLTIVTALGADVLTKINRAKILVVFLLISVYSWQVSRYLHQYYIHYPQTYPAAWQSGFKELVAYTESVKNKYDRVLVTDKYDQPYILFLFYSRYPPSAFQFSHELSVRDQFNFSTVRNYEKYHFEPTTWDKVRDIHSALIVAAPEDIPEVGVNVVKTIYFPGGTPAFKIISN